MSYRSYPLISIIISNFNGAKLNVLQQCLENFKKIDYPNFELLLVDNASTDNSISEAQKIFGKDSRFRIIKNPVNMYSQGVNLGFQAAQGEYIALFNNDIEPGEKYLQKLLTAFKKYPKLAYAQGKLLWYFDHSIIDSAGESMDIYGNPVTLGYKSEDIGSYNKDEEILSATGAACLMKRTALEKVGLYDPNFGIGYEDMDHGLRFRLNGFVNMRIASAVCYHRRGITDLSSEVRVKVRWHFNKNRLSTMIRNYPTSLLLKVLPVTILIYLSNMFWEIIVLRNIPLALTRPKAIWYILTHLSYLLKCRSLIRSNVSKNADKKILILFAPADLLGKVKAVFFDKFSLKSIQYSLPWTYPAEVRRLIPKGATILDIGCGDGNVMEWINYQGWYKVTGVDINQQDLKIARSRVVKLNKSVYENLLVLDLTKKLPFKNKFDVVLCSQVVEHLKKEQSLRLIKIMEKLAKQRVIVATINGFFEFNHREAGKYDRHLSGWSIQDFKSLDYKVFGQGLRIVYKPGALRDFMPKFFHPILFLISYLATPIVRSLYPSALLLISYKDVR